MRNLIGLAAALSFLSIAGCSRVYGGPSVSVTLSAGYSTFCDEALDWDNVFVIDNSRIGIWVMLPSGRWVLRCRSMWFNSAYDDWCFGPWWYDYSVSYGYYPGYCAFNYVSFHWYMHRHHPRWHKRHFHHHNGHYVQKIHRHETYRDHHSKNNAPVMQHNKHQGTAQVIRPHQVEQTAAITKEHSAVRTDGGVRSQQMQYSSPGARQAQTKTERNEPYHDNHSNNVTPAIQHKEQQGNAHIIRPEQQMKNAPAVRPRQAAQTTVITRERSTVRIDGGNRASRMNSGNPAGSHTQVTRSGAITRENSIRSNRSVTRAGSSREVRRK